MQTYVFVGVYACFFSDICVHDCHCMCGCTPPLPLPITMPLPYYSLAQLHCVPPQATQRAGGVIALLVRHIPRSLTSDTTSLQPRRGARGGANSVGLRASRYLHDTLTRPHTLPHTHTTPLHPTTLDSHLPPDHATAPHIHVYFQVGYKLPVWHVPMRFVSSATKDRSTPTFTQTTPLTLINTPVAKST